MEKTLYTRTPSEALIQRGRKLSDRLIKTIDPFPEGIEGRGIVTCAGGYTYFTNAWVLIRMLRHHGCKLPIQLWYLGPNELSYWMKRLVSGFDVECVDGTPLIRNNPYIQKGLIKAGWVLKSSAVARCPFAEVLFLDADNLPVRDPSFLFETPQYAATGAIFWPDSSVFTHPSVWRIFRVPAREEPEFESGQLMADKRINWEAVSLAEKINGRADVFYRLMWGDKDTFRFAWHKLGRTFAMTSFPPQALQAADSSADMLCQHDFAGDRLFQHRIMYKWDLFAPNPWIPGFFLENECRAFLEELKRRWNGRCGKRQVETRTMAAAAIDRELQRTLWLLKVPKNEAQKRIRQPVPWMELRFDRNGTLRKGASEDTGVFWDVSRLATGWELTLSAGDGPRLKLKRAGRGWQGNWVAGAYLGADTKMLALGDVYPHLKNRPGARISSSEAQKIRRHFKHVVHVCLSAAGIGDHIVGAYACAGLARTGVPVVLHSVHAAWLARVQERGLIISSDKPNQGAHNLCYDFECQLRYAVSRAQWYAGGLHPLLRPAKPRVDRAQRMKRLPFEHYVMVSPISTTPLREWPEIHWMRLAHLLREAGYEVVAVGKEQESERLQRIFNQTQVYRVTGHSAAWVMDAMLGAAAYVGGDSGLTHIAALLEVEAVAIHSQMEPEFLWPKNTVKSVVPNARCVFCRGQTERGWLDSCRKGCSALASVQPEAVLDAVLGVVKSAMLPSRSTLADSTNRLDARPRAGKVPKPVVSEHKETLPADNGVSIAAVRSP
ncbi:MAG: glycosyltransferase family 9 protein [Limisphaerales bacterium]